MIKSIIFDLGGVYFTPGTTIAKYKIIELFNIKDYRSLFHIFSSKLKSEGRLIRLGLITLEQFEEALISKLSIPEDSIYHLRELWFGSYVPNYRMEELVKLLSEDYKLIIFSANIKERVEFLNKRYDFLKYFDTHVFSYDYHKDKRDDEFYEVLLNRIDCEPKEAIIIDDVKHVITKAQNLGLNGILYYNTRYIVEELRKYDIKINI